MNSQDTNTGGWETSKMRTEVIPSIKQKLPIYLLNKIKIANKSSYDYTSETSLFTNDDLWIPSYKELGSSYYETNGG